MDSGSIDGARHRYAKLLMAASETDDPRLEQVFEQVRREDFLPPGPWRLYRDGASLDTPDANPVHLYQNALVALDASKGINNGEPFLHAAWLGAVAPRSGEVVCHVGAGTGYYTAMLAMLVQPGGRVEAFEIEADLAEMARKNLARFDNVSVICGDATILPLPPCDLIYVNAGVIAPPRHWLNALRPGGRMIFPWRPMERIGLALVVTRRDTGFEVKPIATAWFIPCVGASSPNLCLKFPDASEAWAVRSLWLTAERPPDATAAALYRDLWFSSAALPSND